MFSFRNLADWRYGPMKFSIVSPEKEEALAKELERLGVQEGEIIEKFIKGSGPGGQKINKTASCVYLKHIPSGIEVKCQKTRSQSLNRYYARWELCQKIANAILGEKTKKQQAAEKIRRQKRRRSRKQKEKMLDEKKKHAVKKKQRTPVRFDDN